MQRNRQSLRSMHTFALYIHTRAKSKRPDIAMNIIRIKVHSLTQSTFCLLEYDISNCLENEIECSEYFCGSVFGTNGGTGSAEGV